MSIFADLTASIDTKNAPLHSDAFLTNHNLKIMKKLQRSCKESCVAEDVKHIFGRRDKECFSLFDTDAVDVRFSPQAYDDDEGICMEIHFSRHLHNDAVDGEVRAVNEFGVGFSGVVGRTVLRPDLVVNGLLGLLDMQFARVAVGVLTSKVIDAVGNVGCLLYLDEEVTGPDGM